MENPCCEAGVPFYWEAMEAEAHNDTWFSTENLAGVCQTAIGSKPGDPFANCIYIFLCTKINGIFFKG